MNIHTQSNKKIHQAVQVKFRDQMNSSGQVLLLNELGKAKSMFHIWDHMSVFSSQVFST